MTAKVTTTAKPAAAAKPAAKTATAKTAKTSTAKTTTTAKSAKTSAKTTATKSTATKKTTASKPAAFAAGDRLPVCSAQALAQSLRLAGQRVTDDEVLELHYLAGGSADAPASIGAVLAAAALSGLAGCRLKGFTNYADVSWGGSLRELRYGVEDGAAHLGLGCLAQRVSDVHGLILHVDVPGPHAVLAAADGWWSWGELYSPWPAWVSEAWAVSWS